MKRRAAGKRPYLSHGSRRQRLLTVAAGIAEREGWTALTMSALAEQGGTSRQLVYQHFANLETLLAQTAQHIFEDAIAQTRDSIAAHPSSLADAARTAEAALSRNLSPGRTDALWQLIAGAGTSPELQQIRRGIRALVQQAWVGPIQRELGLAAADARSLAWMMVMAFWGMRQLVRDGELTLEGGARAYNGMVQRIAPQRARRRVRKPKPSSSAIRVT